MRNQNGRLGTVLAAAALAMVGWGIVAGGCSLRRPMEVALSEPTEEWSPRTAIDVKNFHGTVKVIVDPRVKTAEPTAVVGAKPPLQESFDSKATESVTVVAEWDQQEGGRVLRVRTGTTWYDEDEVWVDLTIRMPSCEGSTVWNRGGWVELVGVSGAIQVDNGPLGSSEGTIRVRTDKPMTDPVTLTTGKGSVVYQVGPGSTGTFELIADEGDAEFASPAAAPRSVRSDGNTTTAQVGKGTNAIRLHSGKGRVRAVVMENPEAYTNKLQ